MKIVERKYLIGIILTLCIYFWYAIKNDSIFRMIDAKSKNLELPIQPSDQVRGNQGSPVREISARRSVPPIGERRQRCRRVDIAELSAGVIEAVRLTALPVWEHPWGIFALERDRTPQGARNLLESILWKPNVSHRPHSFCDTGDLYLFWCTHTNSPKRGFAIRKRDSELMVWAEGDQHMWATQDKEEITNDRTMIMGYLFDPEAWVVYKKQKDADRYRQNEEYRKQMREYAQENAREMRNRGNAVRVVEETATKIEREIDTDK